MIPEASEGGLRMGVHLLLPPSPNNFPPEQDCFDSFCIMMIPCKILKNNSSFFLKFENHALEYVLAFIVGIKYFR